MNNYSINALLKKAAELKASDVHLIAGESPCLRINGIIIKSNLPEMTEDDLVSAIEDMMPVSLKDCSFQSQDFDFPYEIQGVSRFRVNIALSMGRHAITIRLIPYKIPSFEELGLPSSVENFSKMDNGIILITGAAGSGKSTTIASILNHINNTQKKHIITIEDPVEYVYESNKSIFTQRQTGFDTKSFTEGMKYALRQDPDVILIGEIRDMETVESALHTAETGHLVFATLHTFNAIQTFHRILSFFPPSERDSIRSQFAEVFRGSISQKLIQKADKSGRVCAVEILQTTPTIKDFFIKDELEEIYKLVDRGRYNNMITFNMSLYDLYIKGQITQEAAIECSDNPNELRNKIRGVYTGSENSFNSIL